MHPASPSSKNERSEFIDALRKGVLLGAAILVLVLPPMWRAKQEQQQRAAPPPAAVAQAPSARAQQDEEVEAELAAGGSRGGTVESVAEADAGLSGFDDGAKGRKARPGLLADFGKSMAPNDVVHVANWVSYTRDNKKKAFVLIDKKMARLYVFDPQGKLKSSTPILLGKAIGDHTVPGIGNKPLSQVKEHEKTTPAGRFVAEPGKNTNGEDIIWIDYNAAVSMHRLRKVSAAERRAERLATPSEADNRISFGCVNVPPDFYNTVLKPSVMKHGAIVYVLPETKPPQALFASYDVTQGNGMQLARANASHAGR